MIMTNPIKTISIATKISLLVLFTCCQQIQSTFEKVDGRLFPLLGRVLLSDFNSVKIRDTHIDNASLLGKSVIVSGTVHNVGKHYTHLVLQDKGSKIVVDLTNLSHQGGLLAHQRLKILGLVSITSLGQPYLLAKAISLL